MPTSLLKLLGFKKSKTIEEYLVLEDKKEKKIVKIDHKIHRHFYIAGRAMDNGEKYVTKRSLRRVGKLQSQRKRIAKRLERMKKKRGKLEAKQVGMKVDPLAPVDIPVTAPDNRSYGVIAEILHNMVDYVAGQDRNDVIEEAKVEEGDDGTALKADAGEVVQEDAEAVEVYTDTGTDVSKGAETELDADE